MGKVARFTQDNQNPVGMIVQSMLTEAQFQAINGTNWVLAAGQSVTGSQYATITGNSSIPDLRGMFLRGKNNSRSDGNQAPDFTITGLSYSNASTTVTGFPATSPGLTGGISIGQRVTGTNIPPNTTVVSKTAVAIVLSTLPTGAGTSLNFLGEASLGTVQTDAVQRLTGQTAVGMGQVVPNGIFNPVYTGLLGTGTGYGSYTSEFDSARQTNVAGENRPKNVTVNYFIKIN
jgi:hypothetical protein